MLGFTSSIATGSPLAFVAVKLLRIAFIWPPDESVGFQSWLQSIVSIDIASVWLYTKEENPVAPSKPLNISAFKSDIKPVVVDSQYISKTDSTGSVS